MSLIRCSLHFVGWFRTFSSFEGRGGHVISPDLPRARNVWSSVTVGSWVVGIQPFLQVMVEHGRPIRNGGWASWERNEESDRCFETLFFVLILTSMKLPNINGHDAEDPRYEIFLSSQMDNNISATPPAQGMETAHPKKIMVIPKEQFIWAPGAWRFDLFAILVIQSSQETHLNV